MAQLLAKPASEVMYQKMENMDKKDAINADGMLQKRTYDKYEFYQFFDAELIWD